ncbi:hypothetical protein LEP1GSC130_0022 [Leptospira santarosai str. 200403458]|nr:hypothetical protein LEP1GSC130_0022 [Leptospira santarosai str. 200403458]
MFVIRSLLVWGQVQRIICKSRREFRYDQGSPSWVGLVFPKIKKDTNKTNIMRIKWNEIPELSHEKNRKFGAINSKKGSRFQEVNDVAKKSK